MSNRSGSSLLRNILRDAGVGPRRHARASARRLPAKAEEPSWNDVRTTACTHLFERRGGSPARCRHCGVAPPHARTSRRARPGENRSSALEKDVQWAIVQLLVAIGCRHDKKGLHTDIWILGTRRRRGDYQGTRQTPGIGDVFCVLPPLPGALPGSWGFAPPVLWIEVKADDGELSDAQENFRDRVTGRCAYVTGGVDALQAFLREAGYLR